MTIADVGDSMEAGCMDGIWRALGGLRTCYCGERGHVKPAETMELAAVQLTESLIADVQK